MCTSQEEADTIMMLHAIDVPVASQNTNAAIHWRFNPCSGSFSNTWTDPCMLIGHGKSRESIVLKPVYDVLGCPLVRALIGFHSSTGCDTAGPFSGKGKITCWKSFKNFKGWQDHCSGIHWSWTGRSQWCQAVAVQEKSSRVWNAGPN